VGLDDVLERALPYLSIKDVFVLKQVSRAISGTAALHAPSHLSLVKISLSTAGQSLSIFRTYGATLHSVSLQRVTSSDPLAVAAVLALCPSLQRLAIVDVEWSYDDISVAAAVVAQRSLLELRLQCADAVSAERNPFSAIVMRIGGIPTLRKLTLFSRLDAASLAALVAWLRDPRASRRLIKLKVSTGLLSGGDGGGALLDAVAAHGSLAKLTVVRPDGVGEPMRKAHCASLAVAIVKNTRLSSLHLRRVGLWTDSLSALVPACTVVTLRRLKLDGNSLGYLSGGYFVEAMDALLARLPAIEALHLGNNQLVRRPPRGLHSASSRRRSGEQPPPPCEVGAAPAARRTRGAAGAPAQCLASPRLASLRLAPPHLSFRRLARRTPARSRDWPRPLRGTSPRTSIT
jgi:hypothetical protein